MIPTPQLAHAVDAAAARAKRKAINKKRYDRRYARIGKALREGRKP